MLEIGDLQLDKYPGMQLSLYKPGHEEICLTVVFTAGDRSRHRLRDSLKSSAGMYGSLPISGSGWKDLSFSFDTPHLDSDGVTPSPAESLSTIRKLEFVLEMPEEGSNKSYVIIDNIQLGQFSVLKNPVQQVQ